MPRPTGAYDDSPIVIVGWPSQIAEQIRRDEEIAEMSQEAYVPISRSKLVADTRPVKVPFGDDVLNLTYKPSAVNAKQEARELEEREKGLHLLAQARSLKEIIVSWDMVDDEGKPEPVTEEILAELGLEVCKRINDAILDDLLPNRRTAVASVNGSSAAVA